MPGRLLNFSDFAPKPGEFSLLTADLPGRTEQPVGVLLFDPGTNTLHVRLRRDWESVADEDEAEVLSELEEDLLAKAQEQGGAAVLEFLETVAAQSLRISDREAVTVRNFDKTLGDLYRQYVPVAVRRFETHLPRYGLAVAAGTFLQNAADVKEAGEADEWIETPPDLRLEEDMFVAEIHGQSMEPRIPNGSLCVFRRGVVGSRQNRLVLVRNNGSFGDDAFTVKRYKSEKVYSEEGFAHSRIRLESLNPDYPSWDLDPDESQYEIIAEFVRVLE